MHGILFKELKSYVSETWDEDTWSDAMDEAGIEPKLYLPVTEYPDDEATRLVEGITTVTGTDEIDLLRDLGLYIAPALLDTFKAHVEDHWDAMDLLENSGNEVFSVLRSSEGDADEVTATREDEDTVVVEYASPLQMCALAEATLEGIAREHDERVEVVERVCMHHGADVCEIRVSRR